MNNNTIDDNLIGNENNIVFYTDEENNVNVEVILQNENVWLNIDSLTKLFKIDRTGITRHINNIYKDEELEENSTCAKIAQVQKEGRRSVTRNISYYNLDMIISIGFRVNSKPAIKFRTWANKIIKEYNYSQNNLATLIHISRPQVTNIVRLLTLPEPVLNDLSSGRLTYGHAKALVALPESIMQDLLKRIYADNLSVHDVEKLVYAYKHDVNDEKFKKKIDSKYHCDSSYARLQVTFKFNSENERDKFLAELLQNKSKKRAPRPRKPSSK